MWHKHQNGCGDLHCNQFVQTVSYLGICCSINYHALNHTSKPYTSNYFGIGSGLKLILSKYPQLSDGISGVLNSDGLIMLIHHPQIFPTESSHMILIKPMRENYIAVYPIITTCASNVLDLTPQERKCIQPSDYKRDYYTKSDCERQCLVDRIYNTCGCHPYYLPMVENNRVRMCGVNDAGCFAYNFCKYLLVRNSRLTEHLILFVHFSKLQRTQLWPLPASVQWNHISHLIVPYQFGTK